MVVARSIGTVLPDHASHPSRANSRGGGLEVTRGQPAVGEGTKSTSRWGSDRLFPLLPHRAKYRLSIRRGQPPPATMRVPEAKASATGRGKNLTSTQGRSGRLHQSLFLQVLPGILPVVMGVFNAVKCRWVFGKLRRVAQAWRDVPCMIGPRYLFKPDVFYASLLQAPLCERVEVDGNPQRYSR